MCFLLEKSECSNRWDSLIFHKGFKLSRRAPINREKQHLYQRQNNYDSESLRLLRVGYKGLIASPCISRLGGNSSAKPRFHACQHQRPAVPGCTELACL